ncbi:MAG: ABC-type transport auxiliary lipoprotein family protein [Pseudomonadota bacterium]
MRAFLICMCSSLALIGCGETAEPVRFETPTASQAGERVFTAVETISVREVSLPAYATEEGIAVADVSGTIVTEPDNLWADDTARAVTLRLTDALAGITGRQVASDPWPFRDDPHAVVDVRIESFIANASGRFVAEGRYYVAHDTEERGDHAHGFRITQPYDPDGGFQAIAEAQGRVVQLLALDIARRGLR